MAEKAEAVSDWEDVPSVAYAQPKGGGWEDVPAPQAAPALDPTDTAANATMGNPNKQDLKGVAEDYLKQIAHNVSFGLAEKGSAKINEMLGKGTYDENLARNRADMAAAGQRIGIGGQVASALAGGGLAASGLSNLGVTAVGRLAPTAGIIPKVLAGGVEGAGYGAAYGAGNTDTGKPEDYVRNAIEGAKTGGIVGAAAPVVLGAASRLVTPLPSASPERLRMANVLKNEGVDVSAGNLTGNPTLRYAEDTISKLPLGTLIAKNPSEGSMQQLTQAALRKAGIDAPEATADVLQKGFQKIGGQIGSIQTKYPVAVDEALIGEATNIADGIPALLPGRQASANHFLNKVISGQEISPEIAQTTRTQLNRSIRAQNGPQGDKEYQGVLIEIKNALDDALTRTIQKSGNAGDVTALQQARQQYANLHTISDALYSSGAQGQLGTLTPAALQTALARSVGKSNYMQGRGQLNDLASASRAILPTPPESGTFTRHGIMSPVKAAIGLAAQPLVNSRPAQAYLGNQLLPRGIGNELTPPVVAGLLAARDAQKRKGLLSP